MRHALPATFLLTLSAAAFAQTAPKPADIKLVTPTVDKTAQTVTLPAAFWNEHLADWLDVAFCGRPSDFLHETVVCSTTTRSLLEQALRDVGCHDADAWADSVKEFPRVRGDRLLITLEFTRDNKKEKYSLDELITLYHWGVSMGPYGFMFKGDPDHTASQPATAPAGDDAAKILRDDPQLALVFRGIRSLSQSFADHPLAYVEDRWEWEEIHRARNHSLLPAAVFDSNGATAVTLTFQKVTEEQLLTQSAALWHDEAAKAYILQQLPTAKQLDKEKSDYFALRQNANAPADKKERITILSAQIERDYAVLDAAWTSWAVDHLKPEVEDAAGADFIKQQAKRWGEFFALNKERTEQLAIASETPNKQPGRQLVARSRAMLAENKQSRDYWQGEWDKLNEPKPDDVWANSVRLHLDLIDARLAVGNAGVAFGQAQDATPPDEAKIATFKKDLETALSHLSLADARLSLANVNFEISKREGAPGEEAELAQLKKQRDELTAKIKQLQP